jgi:hypothetical protein
VFGGISGAVRAVSPDTLAQVLLLSLILMGALRVVVDMVER